MRFGVAAFFAALPAALYGAGGAAGSGDGSAGAGDGSDAAGDGSDMGEGAGAAHACRGAAGGTASLPGELSSSSSIRSCERLRSRSMPAAERRRLSRFISGRTDGIPLLEPPESDGDDLRAIAADGGDSLREEPNGDDLPKDGRPVRDGRPPSEGRGAKA